MAQKLTDLVLSIIATIMAVALSWPYWREFTYWAESETAWTIYFALGFILAAYVFYAFIGSLRFMFSHAEDEKREAECYERRQREKQQEAEQ